CLNARRSAVDDLAVDRLQERRPRLAAVEGVLEAQVVQAVALEAIGVARVAARAAVAERQRVVFPRSARGRVGDEADRIEPVTAVLARLRVVAEEAVPAKRRAAVLLLDIVLHHVKSVERDARGHACDRAATGAPR